MGDRYVGLFSVRKLPPLPPLAGVEIKPLKEALEIGGLPSHEGMVCDSHTSFNLNSNSDLRFCWHGIDILKILSPQT